MSLAATILAEGKKHLGKYKYNTDPAKVRHADGSLNFSDDLMDCSEFFLYTLSNANAGLYQKLSEKVPSGRIGGNTRTIQAGILKIEGIKDLTKLKQKDPAVGDWILWKGHIEMIEKVNADGSYVTLGANGKADSLVPKNIPCKDFESVKKIAVDFLGIWTPRVEAPLVESLLTRIETLEAQVEALSASSFKAFGAEISALNESFANEAFDLSPAIGDLKTPVHLKTNNTAATRIAVPPAGQAFPLFDGTMPFNNSDEANTKIRNINKVIQFLKPANAAHKRYTPTGNATFCNIYVYDVAYLMGANINKYYIPRVWWMDQAVNNILQGIPQVPAYGTTVKEMAANDLYGWFEAFGSNFGWLKESNLNDMQEYVNTTGEIGIIVGKKTPGHGHITVVVPEQSVEPMGAITAVRNPATQKVINPLQSQAGSKNFEYGQLTIGGQPWFNTGGHTSAFYIFNKL